MSSLKQQLQDDMKQAMRDQAKDRLGTLRLVLAAIKQVEVDKQTEADNDAIIQILSKMVKQRQDAITQFEQGGRQDLADKEKAEIAVIQTYLPEQLSADELAALVADCISKTGANSMKDMGKVMGMLKPQIQGRADMGQVSQLIKQKLS